MTAKKVGGNMVAGNRGQMTERFARFHMADRALKQHIAKWSLESKAYLAPLNAYYDARMVAPNEDHVPEGIKAAGVEAEAICNAAHAKRMELSNRRYELLTEALVAMGQHHGSVMASDGNGTAAARFVRHIRRMAATLKSHMPGSRVVGMEADFASAKGWAKAMGLRDGKAVVAAMQAAGVRQSCRLA